MADVVAEGSNNCRSKVAELLERVGSLHKRLDLAIDEFIAKKVIETRTQNSSLEEREVNALMRTAVAKAELAEAAANTAKEAAVAFANAKTVQGGVDKVVTAAADKCSEARETIQKQLATVSKASLAKKAL